MEVSEVPELPESSGIGRRVLGFGSVAVVVSLVVTVLERDGALGGAPAVHCIAM